MLTSSVVPVTEMISLIAAQVILQEKYKNISCDSGCERESSKDDYVHMG